MEEKRETTWLACASSDNNGHFDSEDIPMGMGIPTSSIYIPKYLWFGPWLGS